MWALTIHVKLGYSPSQCQQQDLDDPNLNHHLPLVYASFNGSPNIFTEKNKQNKLLKIHRSIPTIISTGAGFLPSTHPQATERHERIKGFGTAKILQGLTLPPTTVAMQGLLRKQAKGGKQTSILQETQGGSCPKCPWKSTTCIYIYIAIQYLI